MEAAESQREASLGAPGVRLVHELACPVQPGDSLGRGELASAATRKCAITFPRLFMSLPVSRPGASPISLPLCGLPGIREPKRRGCGAKVVCGNNRIASC